MNGKGYTDYAYVARVNGKRMEFSSIEEYYEYISESETETEEE